MLVLPASSFISLAGTKRLGKTAASRWGLHKPVGRRERLCGKVTFKNGATLFFFRRCLWIWCLKWNHAGGQLSRNMEAIVPVMSSPCDLVLKCFLLMVLLHGRLSVIFSSLMVLILTNFANDLRRDILEHIIPMDHHVISVSREISSRLLWLMPHDVQSTNVFLPQQEFLASR